MESRYFLVLSYSWALLFCIRMVFLLGTMSLLGLQSTMNMFIRGNDSNCVMYQVS